MTALLPFGPDFGQRYPEVPGFKAEGTSKAAAASVDASELRLCVRLALRQEGPMTADECARVLGKSVLSIRPRFSELKAQGVIVDTGERRANDSGRKAIVWRVA